MIVNRQFKQYIRSFVRQFSVKSTMKYSTDIQNINLFFFEQLKNRKTTVCIRVQISTQFEKHLRKKYLIQNKFRPKVKCSLFYDDIIKKQYINTHDITQFQIRMVATRTVKIGESKIKKPPVLLINFNKINKIIFDQANDNFLNDFLRNLEG